MPDLVGKIPIFNILSQQNTYLCWDNIAVSIFQNLKWNLHDFK